MKALLSTKATKLTGNSTITEVEKSEVKGALVFVSIRWEVNEHTASCPPVPVAHSPQSLGAESSEL